MAFLFLGLIFVIGETSSWSIYYPLETICTQKCRDTGKPFGRLLGQTCSCYCPVLNSPEDNDPCEDSEGPSCQLFCQHQGYSGGDCVAGGLCWCFCRTRDAYTPNPTTTTTVAPVSDVTTTEDSDDPTTTVAPAVPPIIIIGGGGGGGLIDIGANDLVPDGSAVAPSDSDAGVTGDTASDVGGDDPSPDGSSTAPDTGFTSGTGTGNSDPPSDPTASSAVESQQGATNGTGSVDPPSVSGSQGATNGTGSSDPPPDAGSQDLISGATDGTGSNDSPSDVNTVSPETGSEGATTDTPTGIGNDDPTAGGNVTAVNAGNQVSSAAPQPTGPPTTTEIPLLTFSHIICATSNASTQTTPPPPKLDSPLPSTPSSAPVNAASNCSAANEISSSKPYPVPSRPESQVASPTPVARPIRPHPPFKPKPKPKPTFGNVEWNASSSSVKPGVQTQTLSWTWNPIKRLSQLRPSKLLNSIENAIANMVMKIIPKRWKF